jgi:hypothetical protein
MSGFAVGLRPKIEEAGDLPGTALCEFYKRTTEKAR